MTRPAPIRTERHGGLRCRDCGATMRLFGIEAHPTIDQTDLLTYVCSHRDGLQTELEPCEKLKVIPSSRMVVPIDARLQDRAFDPETTRLLGSTFDEAGKVSRHLGTGLLTGGARPRSANCSPNPSSRWSSKVREIPNDLPRVPCFVCNMR
jgi:hypothetical protein